MPLSGVDHAWYLLLRATRGSPGLAVLAACAPIAAPPPARITEAAFAPRAGEGVLALAEEDLRFVADRLETRRRTVASRVRDGRLEAAAEAEAARRLASVGFDAAGAARFLGARRDPAPA